MQSQINVLYPKPTVLSTNTPVSGQSLTVGASVTSFVTAFNNYTNLVFVDVQTSDVIVTFDGTNPVSGTRGHRLPAGTNYTWSTATATAAKFIQATAGGILFLSEFGA